MIDVKAASLFPEFVRLNTSREYKTHKQQMACCASTNQNQQENKQRGN